jgi:hypothetical protein
MSPSYAADGTAVTFSLSQLKKQNYRSYASQSQAPLGAMLAYGAGITGGEIMEGRPLVSDEHSPRLRPRL